MTIRFDTPGLRYRDNKTFEFLDSDSLMYFYKTDTVTFQDTFKDGLLTAKNDNPLPLNDDGTLPNVWLQDLQYDVFVDNGDSVQQFVRKIDGGLLFSSDWDGLIAYELGDKVKGSDDNWYIALVENMSLDPISNPLIWTRYRVINIYSSVETYEDGAIVEFTDNFIYTSIQDGNNDNDPDSSPAFWQQPANIVSPTDVAFGGGLRITSTGNKVITGVGFEPTSVFVYFVGDGTYSATLGYFSVSAGIAPGRTSTGSTSNIGVCISGGVFWPTTPKAEALVVDNLLWQVRSPQNPARDYTGELVSLDADGFTINALQVDFEGDLLYVAFK